MPESYKGIFKSKGFRLADARTSVEIVHRIRNQAIAVAGEKHPFLK